MNVKEMTSEQLRAARVEIELEERARYLTQTAAIEDRLQNGPPFSDDELHYSAFNRCPCGAGLAYPDKIGTFGYWDCSDILKGCGDRSKTHTGQLPFSIYDVKGKSERRGTTRPVKPNEN